MAAPRFSVIAVVVGVLAAAGAGAYYFFAVFSAGEQLHAAQAQVETWEQEWVEMRRCVLGEKPMAASVEDSITARELSQGSAAAAMGDCTKAIGKLTRPEGNATGMKRVEEAWLQIDDLASQLAQRYVEHLQSPLTDFGEKSFAAGIDAMAKARAELRAQVKLPVADGAMGPAPRELALVELAVGGERLTQLNVAAATARGELLGRAAAAGKGMVVKLSKGDASVVLEGRAVGGDVTVPLPAGGGVAAITWGVAAEETPKNDVPQGKLFVGALDAAGEVVVGKAPMVSGPWMRPNAAIGEGAARAVLYRNDKSALLSVSGNSGASWKASALAPVYDANLFAGDDFVDVVWMPLAVPQEEERIVSWQRVVASKLPALGSVSSMRGFELRRACAAPGGPWAMVKDQSDASWQILRLDAAKTFGEWVSAGDVGAMRLSDRDAYDFIGCDDGGALLSTGAGAPLWSCRAGKQECERFPWLATSGLGTVVGGAPVVVTIRRELAAVLTAENEPLLVRLPAESKLHSLHGLGDAPMPMLVLQRKDGVLVAAMLPVK